MRTPSKVSPSRILGAESFGEGAGQLQREYELYVPRHGRRLRAPLDGDLCRRRPGRRFAGAPSPRGPRWGASNSSTSWAVRWQGRRAWRPAESYRQKHSTPCEFLEDRVAALPREHGKARMAYPLRVP